MAKDGKKATGDNPFAALKDLFAPKGESDTGGSQSAYTGSGRADNTGASADRRSGGISFGKNKKAFSDNNNDDDVDLFLSAVQNVKPGAKGSRGTVSGGLDMGEIFAALGETSDKKGRRGKPFLPSGKGVSHTQAPTFSAAGKNGSLNSDSREDAALFTAAMGLDAEISEQEQKINRRSEEDLFAKAMAGVAPVGARGREVVKPVEPANPKVQPPVDIMREILEGRIEFALHNTDEYIEGHVVGVDPMIMGRLRAGEFSPEAHIDLHGQNADQAYAALTGFLQNAYQRNMRTVIVITGRGKNSPSGISVIRGLLQTWLTREPFKRVVLGFCSARPHDGGAGAVYVLLRKYKKNRGKIRWDIPYQGPEEG